MIALAVAYEIQCRFSAAVPVMRRASTTPCNSHLHRRERGELLGLSAGEIANAIAIATVDNISLACVHAGPVSQWKGFSPGMTGMRAIYAASLAKRGFEGPSGLLEGPDGLERMFGHRFMWIGTIPRSRSSPDVLKKYCSLIMANPCWRPCLI